MTNYLWNLLKELNNTRCNKKPELSLNIEVQTVKDKLTISQNFNIIFLDATKKVIKNIHKSIRRTENSYYNPKSFFLNKLSAKEIYDIQKN